jgi:transposase-like protein
MHHELKQLAIRLRTEQEMSYDGIRKELGVAKSTLHSWLKNFPLSRERILELRRTAWKKNEAKIELYRTTMAERREARKQKVYEAYRERFQDIPEDSFFIAGLMLYLAEGAKADDYNICVANTDLRVIRFFAMWLSKYFGIFQKDLRVQLHLYPDMDISKEILFWKTGLGFGDHQFYRPEMRKLQKNSFSYRESFRHGTCSLGVCRVEKKIEIMMAIKAFLEVSLTRI